MPFRTMTQEGPLEILSTPYLEESVQSYYQQHRDEILNKSLKYYYAHKEDIRTKQK